jgi:iron uptake system EfeUOB component EfeO/EfeM
MFRASVSVRAWLALTLALAFAVVLLIATRGGSTPQPERGDAVIQRAGDPEPYGPPALATYSEKAPHVASVLIGSTLQGAVQGASPTPPSSLAPLSTAAFKAPVASYRAFSRERLGLMQNQISRLEVALSAHDRNRAKQAWRAAFADYLKLGAVYLEGQIATLDQAINGNPGGLAGGTASLQFSGLHRIEFGLWTGASLSSLQPWARRLAADVVRLRRVLPHVQISPLDYATRAHEVLEDAVRDQLSGTDVPWSGEGVLGTEAGVEATIEVIKTLKPLLQYRENVLGVVNVDLGGLRSTIASIRTAHGGNLPTNAQLTHVQSERLNASLGQALEGLAQVPGALETTNTAQIPQIPLEAVEIDR